ncbi:MAG: hypothetical protein KIG72_00315, partial [Bradymonadales bacterium]|nr:hypothetical protein [Bradymonadales bacterium]
PYKKSFPPRKQRTNLNTLHTPPLALPLVFTRLFCPEPFFLFSYSAYLLRKYGSVLRLFATQIRRAVAVLATGKHRNARDRQHC